MDSIYSYLDNIDVTVCPNDTEDWFSQNKCYDVGFDTESKPIFNADKSHQLAIIQIATPKSVLIYRVYDIPRDNWPISLLNFLEDSNVNKYCVDSRQDNELLNELGINVRGLVDIQPIVNPHHRIGMKKLASSLLNLNLNKSKNIQAGDWSRYPLSIKQIEYAASDAIVCLALAEHLSLTPRKDIISNNPLLDITLVRTMPSNTKSFNGDKQSQIINFLISCGRCRKKELKLESDDQGYISLLSISNLPEFKRFYTNISEVKSFISDDKKNRIILLNDSYKLTK
jgi:hypothetical protein